MGYLAELHSQFKDYADFLTVYIREAHPEDEWQMDPNVDDGVCYPQPRTLADRVKLANDFVARFRYAIPLGVDTMDDAASRTYAGWPERLYVISEDGRIAYKGGMGPFHYKPEEVRAWLEARFPEAVPAVPTAASGL